MLPLNLSCTHHPSQRQPLEHRHTMPSAPVLTAAMCMLPFLAALLLGASTAVHGTSGKQPLHIPSSASLSHCPSRCGDIKISYPFGIGPGCFKQGFELSCNHTAHPPSLFFANSTTQILSSIIDGYNYVYVSTFGFTITKIPGVDTYNRTWDRHLLRVSCWMEEGTI